MNLLRWPLRAMALTLALALAPTLALLAQVDLIEKVKDNQSADALAGFQFSEIVDLETTPVKNQGASGTCWSYCTSSFLESEMIRMGKTPVDLAEMYTVRVVYQEKAERYVRMHGEFNFGQGGSLPDVIDMYQKYGVVPQEAYSGLNYGSDINRHGEVEAMLKGMLDAIIANKNQQLSTVWKDAIAAVLDVYFGKNPDQFEYQGKTYTPQTFASEVVGIQPNDYMLFTSWTTDPFYEKTYLQVPDNWNYGLYYNLPMDDLVSTIDYALREGYTVSWAADVSEKYFSWKNGIAYVPEKEFKDMSEAEKADMFKGPRAERVITPELRQDAFDNYTTTDDHGMQIVGLYKDQTGKEWYKVKNSWGENNDHEGFLYVSKNYVRYKTIAFVVHKDGVPKNLVKKLG